MHGRQAQTIKVVLLGEGALRSQLGRDQQLLKPAGA